MILLLERLARRDSSLQITAVVAELLPRSNVTKTMTKDKRFWSKVDKNGPVPTHVSDLGQCWVWTRALNEHGYGMFSVGKSMLRAHRVSWDMVNDSVPDGMDVLHKCDNRACVRPSHLFLGTDLENNKDMRCKGRDSRGESHKAAMKKTSHLKQPAKGEKNGRSKLDASKVDEIRFSYNRGGVSHRELATRFGVSHATIGSIIRKEWWNY